MLYEAHWSAEEELMLLDALIKYGLGNWLEVADHVGTKDKHECEKHYLSTYINSPRSPLPVSCSIARHDRGKLQRSSN